MNITRHALPILPHKPTNPIVDWALQPEISKHLDIEEQRAQSNEVNRTLVYSETNRVIGRKKAQEYNRRNCIAITEQTPKAWRDLGRAMGFPRNVTCSAKEVARHVAPEYACARSLADDMVNDGLPEETAFEISKEFVRPFKLVLDSGWIPGKTTHKELTRE